MTAKCFILTVPPNHLIANPFQEQNPIVQTYNQPQACNKPGSISPCHPPLAQVQGTNNSTWLGRDVGSLGSVWVWTCKGYRCGHDITSNAQKWKLYKLYPRWQHYAGKATLKAVRFLFRGHLCHEVIHFPTKAQAWKQKYLSLRGKGEQNTFAIWRLILYPS